MPPKNAYSTTESENIFLGSDNSNDCTWIKCSTIG